jgi:hypothetical protein
VATDVRFPARVSARSQAIEQMKKNWLRFARAQPQIATTIFYQKG